MLYAVADGSKENPQSSPLSLFLMLHFICEHTSLQHREEAFSSPLHPFSSLPLFHSLRFLSGSLFDLLWHITNDRCWMKAALSWKCQQKAVNR